MAPRTAGVRVPELIGPGKGAFRLMLRCTRRKARKNPVDGLAGWWENTVAWQAVCIRIEFSTPYSFLSLRWGCILALLGFSLGPLIRAGS